jgi:hypothetical protein
MLFTPDKGAHDPLALGVMMTELALCSVVLAWFLEHGNRSMAIAIAMHAGAHLDNVTRAPASEVRLRILRLVVVGVAAALAAHALTARAKRRAAGADRTRAAG